MDLGLKDFAITSDGLNSRTTDIPKKYERDLAKAQKHLSRKQKGNSFERQNEKSPRYTRKYPTQDKMYYIRYRINLYLTMT